VSIFLVETTSKNKRLLDIIKQKTVFVGTGNEQEKPRNGFFSDSTINQRIVVIAIVASHKSNNSIISFMAFLTHRAISR